MAETEVNSCSCREEEEEEEEEEEFDGDFKEYMAREQLQWSRLKSSGEPEEDASADSLFVSIGKALDGSSEAHKMAPKGLGALLGLAQLILYAIFYNKSKKQKLMESKGKGEMGLNGNPKV